MTRVAILPEPTDQGVAAYRAIAGAKQSLGKTAGTALDALTAELPADEAGTIIVVQHRRPDRFFTAEQRERLELLMASWRAGRDANTALPEAEQHELEALVEAEARAAANRAAALVREMEG